MEGYFVRKIKYTIVYGKLNFQLFQPIPVKAHSYHPSQSNLATINNAQTSNIKFESRAYIYHALAGVSF